MIALSAEEWGIFREMPLRAFAQWLRQVAKHVDLSRYPKSHRGAQEAQREPNV